MHSDFQVLVDEVLLRSGLKTEGESVIDFIARIFSDYEALLSKHQRLQDRLDRVITAVTAVGGQLVRDAVTEALPDPELVVPKKAGLYMGTVDEALCICKVAPRIGGEELVVLGLVSIDPDVHTRMVTNHIPLSDVKWSYDPETDLPIVAWG